MDYIKLVLNNPEKSAIYGALLVGFLMVVIIIASRSKRRHNR